MYFNAEREEPLIQKPSLVKTKLRHSQMKETKNVVTRRPIPMSKGSSINRNKIIKEGVLKQQEGIKNTISKSMDKYSRLQLYLVKI